MKDVKDLAAVSEQPTQSAKRPYEAPRIEESGGFETMVLACLRQVNGTPVAPSGCEGMLRS